MTTTETITLASILKRMFDRPESSIGINALETIANQLDHAEQILKDLQDLKECLLSCQVVSKADTLALMKTLRKVYTYLGVYPEIESVWPDVRDGLNDSAVTFNGKDLYDRLLINKNIIVQNRTLFAARKTFAEIRANKGKSSSLSQFFSRNH